MGQLSLLDVVELPSQKPPDEPTCSIVAVENLGLSAQNLDQMIQMMASAMVAVVQARGRVRDDR
ncbi:MAG: hypothetical protein V3W41_19395 [Planctomycetota bacterium]